MRKWIFCVVVLFLTFQAGIKISEAVLPNIPDDIKYQGRLVDSSGTPITGATEIVLRLYHKIFYGGNDLLIKEQRSTITPDAQGYFSVLFEDIPINLDHQNELLVEVVVAGHALPKEPLLPVPLAMWARYANLPPGFQISHGGIMYPGVANKVLISDSPTNGVVWRDVSSLGVAGATGPKGDTGPKGNTGATGPVGAVGAVGAMGTTGPKGDTGATGSQGPAGPVAGSNKQLIYNNNGVAAGAQVYQTTGWGGSINIGIGTSEPSVTGTGIDINGMTSYGTIVLRDNSSYLRLGTGGNSAIMHFRDDFSIKSLSEDNYVNERLKITNAGTVEIDNRLGIKTDPGTYRLKVSGNAYATGTWASSDQRFKKNVMTLSDSLAKLKNLRGVAYEWNDLSASHGHQAGQKDVGLIAQEVEPYFPELVNTDTDGYKALNYDKLSAVLVEAIKEQQKEIEILKDEIRQLKQGD